MIVYTMVFAQTGSKLTRHTQLGLTGFGCGLEALGGCFEATAL